MLECGSLGILNDLINFWQEYIKNKMAAGGLTWKYLTWMFLVGKSTLPVINLTKSIG